jgi:hypothetical protein
LTKKIVLGGWFDLPRVGRDVFAVLMKQGVVYDKSMGFKLDPATDLPAAVRTIRAATGENVELVLRCFIDGKEACAGCPYLSSCDRTSVSSLCLCAEHSADRSAFELYAKNFDLLLRA